MHLQQRQVLERGGVEDDLRPVDGEHLVDPSGVTDVGQYEFGSSNIARPSIESCVPCRPLSSRSSITNDAGSNATSWRHSSLPIEPPAPVTSTRRPVM